MQTILRLEHQDSGLGIYKHHENDEKFFWNLPSNEEINEFHRELPTPNAEPKLRGIDEDEFCAFQNTDQLKTWFRLEWILELVVYGFRIYQIQISECRIGDYQVLFKKTDVITKNDITDEIIKNYD